jgi:hypothetical protein
MFEPFNCKSNSVYRPQKFGSLVSHACAAEHFLDPEFHRLIRDLGESFNWHRKLWEYATIAMVSRLANSDMPRLAIGFGVGTEPLASYFAANSWSVLATDQPPDGTSSEWASTGQYASNLSDLWKRNLVDEAVFSRAVRFAHLDMCHLPLDLPEADFMWSSCVIEHIGGVEPVRDFLKKSFAKLKPGGIAIHTTEYELGDQVETRDYGHCAVFRDIDFLQFQNDIRSLGGNIELSLFVPNDSYADKWVSQPPYPDDQPHLKLKLVDSITTSLAFIFQRPPNS